MLSKTTTGNNFIKLKQFWLTISHQVLSLWPETSIRKRSELAIFLLFIHTRKLSSPSLLRRFSTNFLDYLSTSEFLILFIAYNLDKRYHLSVLTLRWMLRAGSIINVQHKFIHILQVYSRIKFFHKQSLQDSCTLYKLKIANVV